MEPFVFVTGLYFDSELQEDIRCKIFIKILPLFIAFFSRIYFPIQNLNNPLSIVVHKGEGVQK